ncbi:MAG TPA: DNA-directed RNA polymerase subunit D [archaeon]|nr:DNA-directed RNA polymerase subunit D [archaeon]
MNIKVLDKSDSKLSFVLDGVTPAFANSLRRIMVSEVPTLAIDTVSFHENGSVLFDEVIAHRLGLVPIEFSPKDYNTKEECKCKGKGCASCQVVFALEKTGPAAVYSGDLKSSDKSVKPVDDKVLLVELGEGQALKLEATARMGTGIEHAKWQAANAVYQYYPEIKVTDKDKLQRHLKGSAKGLFVEKGAKLEPTDLTRADVYKQLEDETEAIKVDFDTTKFLFKVESVSGLEPEHIVSASAKILEEKAATFKHELTDLKL